MRSLKFLAAVSLVSILNLAGLVVIAGMMRFSAGAGPVATMNGDVNGDGSINLGDAVYLLHYIFESGAPPVAIAGPSQPAKMLFPHPADLVNVSTGTLFPPDGIVTIQPGTGVVMYDVPPDKWLVVQGFFFGEGGSNLELVQNLGGAVSMKIDRQTFGRIAPGGTAEFPPGGGLQFEPGSQVEVRNVPSGSASVFAGVMTGYLVDAP
ncbi:MAG: hypothetical protein ACKVX7_12555 [Planctomycetota bacterium]